MREEEGRVVQKLYIVEGLCMLGGWRGAGGSGGGKELQCCEGGV